MDMNDIFREEEDKAMERTRKEMEAEAAARAALSPEERARQDATLAAKLESFYSSDWETSEDEDEDEDEDEEE
ncbi:hypothetical protein CPT_Sonora_064 [Stenotrophomonas phage Sonora]|nr:hypothetical protein CPT_Sonora_064 [Stenotrophomonas phage Sonora]